MVLYLLGLSTMYDLKQFRLQSNGSWRECARTDPLSKKDFRTEDASDILAKWGEDSAIEIGGVTYRLEPNEDFFSDHIEKLETTLYFDVRVLRRDFPSPPSKRQLIDLIGQADLDDYASLIADINGEYEFHTVPVVRQDPSIVVWHSCVNPDDDLLVHESDYHGEAVDQYHADTLAAWIKHLNEGRVQQHSDTETRDPIGKLEAELEALRAQWRPQY